MQLSEKERHILIQFFSNKPVLKVYVFGSYSRSEAREDSALDLLVELDYSQPIGLSFVKMKLDLEHMLHKRIDFVSYKAVSRYILPYINHEKKLIYER